VAARLLTDRLAAGEQVVLVPPRLMATARQASRVPGKSDPTDALAVARAALQEPQLPQARLDGPPVGQAAGRPPRRPGRRADPGPGPAALAPPMTWILSGRPPRPPGTWNSGGSQEELEAWLAELPASVPGRPSFGSWWAAAGR
jgi:hypothetical protein